MGLKELKWWIFRYWEQSWKWLIEEKNHVCDLRISPRNYYDLLPLELLEATFLRAIMSSDFLFPNHACRTFNNLIVAYPVFKRVKRKCKQHLRRVHLGDFKSDPKSISSTSEMATVSIRRIYKYFSPHGGIMRSLRCIINTPTWHNAWLILGAEAFGFVYHFKYLFGKMRNTNDCIISLYM